MALAHNLGFPRIGADRELKKALEAYWKGDIDHAALQAVGRELRAKHWQLQKDAGIDLLPVGDFAWYDQVLTHSLSFGAIPERFSSTLDDVGRPTLDSLFAMARGASQSCCGGEHSQGQYAQELTKWFDTNYHYLVPEFTPAQRFELSWNELFEEVDEALALGHKVNACIFLQLPVFGAQFTAHGVKCGLIDIAFPVGFKGFFQFAIRADAWETKIVSQGHNGIPPCQ